MVNRPCLLIMFLVSVYTALFDTRLNWFLTSDLKLHLQGTDYGPLLSNDASPLLVQTIDERLKERLVHEFTHIRNQSLAPLSEFLDYMT